MKDASAISDPVRPLRAELIALSRLASQLSLPSVCGHRPSGGAFLSRLRGRGMEFEESRPYTPGDDVRCLDWRVTARTGRVHTKLFRDERERPVLLWLDLCASMRFATRGALKAVQASRAAVLLAWAAVHGSDRIGALVFQEHRHHEFRPRRGHAAVLGLIHYLSSLPLWSAPVHALEQEHMEQARRHALSRLACVARPGSLIILCSDFRHLDEHAASRMQQLAAHSELCFLWFYDVLERELPAGGVYGSATGTVGTVW